MSRPYQVQSREQFEVNTDPQRRCYDGAHFQSEMRWTEWRDLTAHTTQVDAEESVASWQELAKTAKSRVLEYRWIHHPQPTKE